MRHKWLNTLGLFLITFIYSNLSIAQTLHAEQQELAKYQQQLSTLQAQQQQLQASLQKNNQALKPLLQKKSPEQELLNDAQEQLNQAKINFQAENSPDNQARIKNAEFKYALAERKFNKANEDLVELQQKTDELNAQLAATNNKITNLNKQKDAQHALIAKLKAQQADTQSRQAEQQKLTAAAAQAEIARLKAQLKQQELEAQAKIERAREEAATVAATVTTANKVNTTTTAAVIPAATAKAQTTQLNAAATIQKTQGITLLNNTDQVRAEESRIKQLLATETGSRDKGYNKILNIKIIDSNGNAGPAEANSLRPLGHDNYRGTVTLNNGTNLFSIGFNRWEQQVSAAGAGTKFEVIYDESNPKTPRLIYYPAILAPAQP
ncbi:MAG: hypothetical protein WCY88_14740 [Spongiibacteraceae bacterium]